MRFSINRISMPSVSLGLRSTLHLCWMALIPPLWFSAAHAALVPTSSTREISISSDATSASGETASFLDAAAATFPDPFDQHVDGDECLPGVGPGEHSRVVPDAHLESWM